MHSCQIADRKQVYKETPLEAETDASLWLSIQLFGKLDVRWGNRRMKPLRTKKGWSLLALLVIKNGCEVERKALIEMLWGDVGERQGRQSLAKCLNDLRTKLRELDGREHIANLYGNPSLDLQNCWVDVLKFKEIRSRRDPDALQTAYQIYKGDFLPGCEETYVREYRDAFMEGYFTVVYALASVALEAKEFKTALELARSAIQLDPSREEMQRILLQIYANAGEFDRVIDTYNELQQYLHREYSRRPDAETEALYDRLRKSRNVLLSVKEFSTPLSSSLWNDNITGDPNGQIRNAILVTGSLPSLSQTAVRRITKRVEQARFASYPFPFQSEALRRSFATKCYEEMRIMFRKTDIYDSRNLRDLILEYTRSENGLQDILMNDLRVLMRTTSEMTANDQVSPWALEERGLSVSLPGTLFGTMVLFEYLTLAQGFHIRLAYNYAVGRELQEKMITAPPSDLVVLPLTASVRYLIACRDREYRPIMLMPRGSHRIMCSGNGMRLALNTPRTTILLPGEGIITTASTYLEALEKLKFLDRSRMDQISMSPDHISTILKDNDAKVRAVMWFPHNIVNELLYGFHYLDNPRLNEASLESVLFAHRRVYSNSILLKALMQALASAYEAMVSDNDMLKLFTEITLSDANYIAYLMRVTGVTKG